jgi:hypothetical protein
MEKRTTDKDKSKTRSMTKALIVWATFLSLSGFDPWSSVVDSKSGA